jgi:2-polyprenyl-6-methoxyphenol hydroxylase-like FAD-dependent oxidoreductase
MNNASHASDCQVLIVGAGPTGLVLAAELLARGIRARIVEKGNGVVLETRALGVHARTLEVLDLRGLADRFVEHGHEVRRFQWYSDGRCLGNLDLSKNGSRFGFMLDIPQHVTERLLRQRVGELGGVVEGNTELMTLTQCSDRVTATVKDCTGGVREITAHYAVGCGGAHSRVRHQLGLGFDGHAYEEDWLLADVLMDWARPEDEVHAFFRTDGLPMICFPMRDHVWRVVRPYSGDRGRQSPSLEEVQQLVDQRAPEPVVVSNPTWLANFRCSRRSTNAYRQGRVMLAGDAVHVHTPAGGQGMNTGIMDAHNLAWKLAQVASGQSPDSLLDTYGEERGPVAADVLELTHALVQIATVKQPVKRLLRDAIVPIACRISSLQRRAVRRLSHEHVTYSSSSLTQFDPRSSGMRPGDPAPDVPVAVPGDSSVTRLYEALRSTRHVLLVGSTSDPWSLEHSELRRFRQVVDVVVGDFEHACAGAAWLVRPDGYIAASGTAERMPAVLEYLRRVFAGSGTRAGYTVWAA